MNNFQFLLGCYLSSSIVDMLSEMFLSIPFGMLRKNTLTHSASTLAFNSFWDVTAAVLAALTVVIAVFQFLLGCYADRLSGLVFERLPFQFLLGCYSPRGSMSYEQGFLFQFLLGCYIRGENFTYSDIQGLSIPFGMLRHNTHHVLQVKRGNFQFLLGCYEEHRVRVLNRTTAHFQFLLGCY